MNTDLVLVHGFLGSALNWGPVLHRLSKHEDVKNIKVRAVDLLGHGARRFEAVKFEGHRLSLELTASDLATQIPDGNFVALGHSFGLRPLLRLAARIPDRMVGLIAEDSGPALSQYGYDFLTDVLKRTPVPFMGREQSKAFFDSKFGSGSAMSRFLQSHIREINPGEHAWRFSAHDLLGLLDEAFDNPLWSEWSNYPGPVLMVVGDQSDYMTKDRITQALKAREGKHTELVQIPKCGHWVHSEQLDLFVDAVARWLTSHRF